MAETDFTSLPAFGGAIDPVNDVLAIVNYSDNETQQINRNTLLNLTSQPLGLTDSQSPTNKTFDNTNTITLKDTLFTLQDNSDVTKQLQFQLSGISTATTRTLTIPNTDTTIVGTDATQTLTNKTLTSPVINTATIANPTITVDSISEYTSAHGVTVDGLNIKDGALNTNNSVVTANITDSAVTPAKLLAGTGAVWSLQSFTPTLNNFTLGNGTKSGGYIQTGKIVYGEIYIACGSSSAFGTTMTFNLPVTASSKYSSQRVTPVGMVDFHDSGTAFYTGFIYLDSSATVATVNVQNAAGTYVALNTTTATVPFTIAAGDTIAISFWYEAA